MLADHFRNRVTISRRVITGKKTTFEAVATNIPCHIQPMSPTYQNGQWGRLQKEYRLFTETPLEIGDKLEDESLNKYEVFGLQSFNFRTGQRHYEALIRGV